MSIIVRIGAFSSDPSACDAFHAMDPESGILYPAINDSLVYLDCEGVMQPGLATAWRRVDPLTIELDLREGVRFHNGDRFDAGDVVETLRVQRDPQYRAPNGQGILSSIERCTREGEYRVRIKTYHPDGMLLHRLHIASAVYPRRILEKHGPAYFLDHPIGTGAYAFERWDRGREIALAKNPDHWAGKVTVDGLRFPIMAQKDWVDALTRAELDIALNVDAHDAYRLEREPGVAVRRREAALSHWFLLCNRGPLADRRVRLALNYAVHRHLLCAVANHGWASPQASLLTPGQVGYDPSIPPYPYDPEYAAHLLREAGLGGGFRLRGLVSETSASVYRLVRVFLEKIGVVLDAEIVPRPEWLRRIVTARIMGDAEFDGDFALANIDNFTLHGLFHHAIFLRSGGPFSLTRSPEYDARFLEAAVQIEPAQMASSLARLDRHAHDEALLLFTIRQQVYCGVRRGYDIPLSVAGHFNYDNLWRLRFDPAADPAPPAAYALEHRGPDPELQRILDGSSYPGILYDPVRAPFTQPLLGALWRNLELYEQRWKIQSEEMLRTLVEQVTSSTNLENVLRSTTQVGILGVTATGRVLFENTGYRRVMGHGGDAPLGEILRDGRGQEAWSAVTESVQASGQYAGVLDVLVPGEAARRVFLTASPAINELGTSVGYVCVLTDHSGEEERLRMGQEMAVAERIQTALLPSIPADAADRLAAVMVPADEVGGDYYDIITDADGHEWYGIGDVSGHGVTSGLIMLITHSIISAIIRTDPHLPLATILERLNQVLYEDVQVRMAESYHLTFALLKSLGDGDYLAAGAHEDLVIHRAASESCEIVPLQGMWFGLMPEVEAFTEARIHLDPGDTMVLYTDGVVEAEAKGGELWEAARFHASIRRHAHLAPAAMKDAILADVRAFMGAQLDDITLLIVRRPR